MRYVSGGAFACLFAVALAASAHGCSTAADDCDFRAQLNCPGSAASAGATGTNGGSAAGGASAGEAGDSGSGSGGDAGGGTTGGSSTGGGAAGSVGSEPCGGKCGGSTPRCDEDTGKCVQCLTHENCLGNERPFCDPDAQECVFCLDNEDCKSEGASKCEAGECVACEASEDCAHLSGKTACDMTAGECVECTGLDYGACGEDAGTPLVCDSLSRTCTTHPEHDAGLCIPCVSDAHCKLGQMCVLQQYGDPAEDVGYFCHWKQAGGDGAPSDCFATGRPYVELIEAATSIDDQTANICTLRVSTCPARNEFGLQQCGTAAPDDTLCSFAPPGDSKCVQASPTAYRCTMTCGNDDDCPVGFECDTGASPPVCEL